MLVEIPSAANETDRDEADEKEEHAPTERERKKRGKRISLARPDSERLAARGGPMVSSSLC
jgi:hypothetical protein